MTELAAVRRPAPLAPPPYDRARLATGIVHFGPGAFHRAHQADYIDRLLADDPRWGIAAVALRSAATIAPLRAQDGLYTLMLAGPETRYRLLGPHRAFHGPDETATIRARLLSPDVRLVTTTVTEKGYALASDGTLDMAHPDIVHDLAAPVAPRSIVGWLALGLADRRRAGLPAFTTLCCDNLANNGRKLGAAVAAFAHALDPELARWIAGEAVFPDAMVDSITPATDDATRATVLQATGFADAAPVRREPYAAWVIEDMLPAGSPDLASVGVRMTSDVAAWERAKLRILNGAHSTLAWLGLLAGCATVDAAMRHPRIGRFVRAMIDREVVPSLPAAFDLAAYADEIFARFDNPVIAHRLEQIAIDSSQKLPYRLLDSLAAATGPAPRLTVAIAAWMAFVIRRARTGTVIADPLADALAKAGRDPDPVPALLAIRAVFPAALASDPAFRDTVQRAVTQLLTRGIDCLEDEDA